MDKQQDWAQVDAKSRAAFISKAMTAAHKAYDKGCKEEAEQCMDAIRGVLEGGPKNLPKDEQEQFDNLLRLLQGN